MRVRFRVGVRVRVRVGVRCSVGVYSGYSHSKKSVYVRRFEQAMATPRKSRRRPTSAVRTW